MKNENNLELKYRSTITLTKKTKSRYYLKTIILVLLLLWLIIVFSLTVFGRQPFEGQHFQPEVFWSYRSAQLKEAWFVRQIIGNVAMYIPFGFIFPFLFKDKLDGWKVFVITLLAGIVISFCTESIQYIFKIGLFEFDDIIHNALGTVIGFLLSRIAVGFIKYDKGMFRV